MLTYGLQSVLPTRCAGLKVVQSLWEWPSNDWSTLRPTIEKGVHARHCLDGQELEAGWLKDLAGLAKNKIKEILRKEKSGGMSWELTQQENMFARLIIPHT